LTLESSPETGAVTANLVPAAVVNMATMAAAAESQIVNLKASTLKAVTENPGKTSTELRRLVTGGNEPKNVALRELVEAGQVKATRQGQKTLHYLSDS
jgi:predicted transcriptional regulator